MSTKIPTMNDTTPTRRSVNQVNDQKAWDGVQAGTLASRLAGRLGGGELTDGFVGWQGWLAGRLAGRLVGVCGGLGEGRLRRVEWVNG